MNKMLRNLIAPMCMLFVMAYASDANHSTEQIIKLKGSSSSVHSEKQALMDNAASEKQALMNEINKATSEKQALMNEMNKAKSEKQALMNEMNKAKSEKQALMNSLGDIKSIQAQNLEAVSNQESVSFEKQELMESWQLKMNAKAAKERADMDKKAEMMINDQAHLKAEIMSNHTRSNCDNTDSCYPNDGYCDDGYSWCGYETGVDCTDCGNCPGEECTDDGGSEPENCGNTDTCWPNDGYCDDGYSWCGYETGVDCTDCGNCPDEDCADGSDDGGSDDGGSDDGGSEPENCGNTDTCYPNDGYCDDGYSWCGYETGVDCTDCGNCPDEDCADGSDDGGSDDGGSEPENCGNTDTCYPNDGYCDDGYSWCGYETGVDCTDCGNCPDEDCPEPEGCIWDASNYGAADCDAAWTDYGLNCQQLLDGYSWICDGCDCPGDPEAVCGDGSCTWGEDADSCYADCGIISGCTDPYALNYDEDATEEDGSCGYTCEEIGYNYTDCAGTCFNDEDCTYLDSCLAWATDDYCDDGAYGLDFQCEEWGFDNGACGDVQDCAGVWNGDAVEDCAGECNGSAVEDDCGECNGDGCSCTPKGDVNDDGAINVADIVVLVGAILSENYDEMTCPAAGDANNDGGYNVLDAIVVVSIILGKTDVAEADYAKVIKTHQGLRFESNGLVGFELVLQHGSDFDFTLPEAAIAKGANADGTRMVVINDNNNIIFNSTDEYEIVEVIAGSSSGKSVAVQIIDATRFGLSDAYPNPFNPSTTLDLTVPEAGHVNVQVYNVMGQVVATLANGYMNANAYTLNWNAGSNASGLYFIKAESAGNVQVQKVMLMK